MVRHEHDLVVLGAQDCDLKRDGSQSATHAPDKLAEKHGPTLLYVLEK